MISSAFLTAYLTVLAALDRIAARVGSLLHPTDERGQASAEYALVLLGAALLAIFFAKWLTESETLPKIFGDIIQKITGDMPK